MFSDEILLFVIALYIIIFLIFKHLRIQEQVVDLQKYDSAVNQLTSVQVVLFHPKDLLEPVVRNVFSHYLVVLYSFRLRQFK